MVCSLLVSFFRKTGSITQSSKDLCRLSKRTIIGLAPLPKFCYILAELIEPQGDETDAWIRDLIAYEKKKKCEDISSWGYCLRAITDEDIQQFQSHMDIILRKHHNAVRFGSLRETAEGFYCMEGMMLCFCALYRGMEVSINSKYISMDYLRFILDKIGEGRKNRKWLGWINNNMVA